MSTLNLDETECDLLVELGWSLSRVADGPEFTLELVHRKVTMRPVLTRSLKPMICRTQARRYDSNYSDAAKAVGWPGWKFLPSKKDARAMARFELEKFDKEFSTEITGILRRWALNADPKQLISDSIGRRKELRNKLYIDDLINYAYLGRVEDLEAVALDEDDNAEYLSPNEDSTCLVNAIEFAKSV